MSRMTHVRIISQPLLDNLTRPQAIMSCDVRSLYAAAATVTDGAALTSDQSGALETAWHVLGGGAPVRVQPGLPAPERTLLARSIGLLADSAASEQRRLIAATVANTLEAEDWTVTVVQGGPPGRYSGIEATRACEHLIVAVGPGELIVDQSEARDCGATVDMIISGLREIGWTTVVADDPPHHGPAGSLYVLPGGPTRAHAVQAALRYDLRPVSTADRPPAQVGLRITAG